MKNLVLVSAVAAALFVAGCSSKAPEVDMNADANKMSNGSMSNTDMMSDAERMAALANQIQSQVKNVYFDFDKFAIRSDMQEVINTNASLFNQSGAESLKIMIEGNCDEWGSDEYNYALGVKRAKAAKDSLVNQGVSEDRIEITSNGESKPVCTEKTKACDAQNRRDEFKVLP
ncbi:OmpA family protein [Campylobacter hyointestinalis]|uniref:Peptidoglycan-associated lipoprotein n=2 Tax=Campylobacter hyointestinalis TaxID=198 RepID=A0AAV6EEF0_CAMHY|nr:OmpA family protein [Campylobacter hyointestinalis]ANE34894.1 Tol-Pal system peptidoglycan-associated lipoprotein [Campylobacter hyointestinalis subsp. lawsonii CCUG 27631]KAB0612434.1 OmpA family protein [Campylobacter hyointestinalis subsp. lawsonii]QKF68886.1 Tol-Pal system peptidoglycan-associated lipoprotein [Campylobacter hyointestinalis subsp. lawsonii]RAZ27459.1 peptidoglycan-associated lipoprotein [Campylobacter hyointestinalis subsp. lawsonii]RAZ46753.1 peptidoglycan-associated li